jgi:polyketide synthase 12
LAGYFQRELVGASAEAAPKAVPGEEEIQRVVASIPVKRLRHAGVLELLLSLANEAEGADADMNREKDLATMDLDDLVNAAFLDDDD